jgi:hypothetical protein
MISPTLLTASLVVASIPVTTSPTRAEIEAAMGMPSTGDEVRGQRDTVGFVVTEAQTEEAVTTAIRLERQSLDRQDRRLGMTPKSGFVGGVCAHDDHLYAARADLHLTERITAPRVPFQGADRGRCQPWASSFPGRRSRTTW